jgi:hypothetical protein
VKADWAHELSGYENAPESVAYALQNLPARAPTVLEFRAICRAAPQTKMPMLESGSATYTPEVAKKALAEARALLTRSRL